MKGHSSLSRTVTSAGRPARAARQLRNRLDDGSPEAELQRPIRNTPYRQYPRLREELYSLGFRIGGSSAKPTAPQAARLVELIDETAAALTKLDDLVAEHIVPLNEQVCDLPPIAAKPREE